MNAIKIEIPSLRKIIAYGYNNEKYNIRIYCPQLNDGYFNLRFLYDTSRAPKTFLLFERVKISNNKYYTVKELDCFVSSIKEAVSQIIMILKWYYGNRKLILIPDIITFIDILNFKYTKLSLGKYYRRIIKEQLDNISVTLRDLEKPSRLYMRKAEQIAINEWLVLDSDPKYVLELYEMLKNNEGIKRLYEEGVPNIDNDPEELDSEVEENSEEEESSTDEENSEEEK